MKPPRKYKKTTVKRARRDSHASADAVAARSRLSNSLLALESRIMFDGAAAATVTTVTTEQNAQSQTEASFGVDDATTADSAPAAPTGEPPPTNGDQALFDALAAYDTSTARQEIVFLSPSVLDYQKLLDGISPNVEVIVLDPARDGVEQMAEVLAGRMDIDAIHIISHGAQAELTLGAARLTLESMNGVYANELAAIGQSLSEKADLLIYGCSFGQGEGGVEAAIRLGQLTGADVAASTDDTGHASLGGDWDLEHTVGPVETSQLFATDVQQDWSHLMATETIIDNFNVAAYNNNNGSQSWSTDWVETDNGGGGAGGGNILVTGNALFIDMGLGTIGNKIYREVDLTGALSATLTYSHIASLGVGGSIEVQISADGGANYTTLKTYSALPSSGPENFDITAYISANTRVRFEVTGALLLNTFQFDDVRISYITNDAPVATNLNAAETYTEDTPLDLTNIVVTDLDSVNVTATLTLSDLAAGSLSTATSGSVTSTYNAAMGIWTASGAIGDVNALLAGVTFTPASNYNSNFTMTTSIDDGVAAPITGVKNMTGTAVNDPPNAVIIPASYSATEQTTLILHGTGLSVSDVDAGAATVSATLSVGEGQLNVSAGTTGVTVGGSGTSSVTLNGTLVQINDLLAGNNSGTVVYFNGSDTPSASTTLTLSIDDGGNTGSGGALNASDIHTITIAAVNDAPANAAPGAQTVTEDTALAIGGVSVNDVDGNLSTVQLTVANGTVTVSLAGGAMISNGANGSATLTLSGTKADINTTLASLIYQGTLNYTGPDTLTITSTDTGNATDLDPVTITVTPINDAPVITNDGGGTTAAVNADESQNRATTVTKTDVDGGSHIFSIVGGADAGLFTLNPITGLLTFNTTPDFEAPIDSGANNVYNVAVRVTDGSGGVDTQALSIMVNDVPEGLPPIPQPPPIPPNLVPQPPALPPRGGLPPIGSPPPQPPIMVGPPISPPPGPGTPFVPVGPDNGSGGITPPPPLTAGLVAARDVNTPVPSFPIGREPLGYLEERIAPLMYQTSEEVQKIFDKRTVREGPAQLAKAFEKTLNVVEEELQQATDISENHRQFVIRVTNIGGITLTAGLITWLLQSGALLASLTATLPAWRHFDPLPVVLVGDRERRKRKADTAAAAEHENKQFRGLKGLLDRKGERSGGGGRAA